jgi:hypothetical protein
LQLPLVCFFGVLVSQLLFKFSHNAIIAPYAGGTALMIRLSPFKILILLMPKLK